MDNGGKNDRQQNSACCSTSENPIDLDSINITSIKDEEDLSDSSLLHSVKNNIDVNIADFKKEVTCLFFKCCKNCI